MAVIAKYELEGDTVSFTLPFGNYIQFLDRTTTCEGERFFKENKECKVSVPFQGIRTISQILKDMGIEVDASELNEKLGPPIYSDLGQMFLRPEQYEFLKKAMRLWSGVLSLPTAYGKNVMIVYLCMCSEIRNKNILICAPSYSIVDEIKQRFERYGIPISTDMSESSKIWAINPVGFMARKDIDKYQSWLDNVDMLIVDECDTVTNSLEDLIVDRLPNAKIHLGFSATVDKLNGANLTKIRNFNSLRSETAKILKYLGPAIGHKTPSKVIRIVESDIAFGNYNNLWSYDKCVNQVWHSPRMVPYLKACIEDNNRYARSTILIPFTNRGHVAYLLLEPKLKKYSIAMWTAGGIRFNDREEEPNSGLERVKELVNHHEIDVLLTTSVGFKGVDITELKSVMFITGSSYGSVTQILGRVFRYQGDGCPTVYLPRNISENPLYNKAYRSRREIVFRNDHYEERLLVGYHA